MCGICGVVKKSPEPLGPVIQRMNDAQAHRGPDGEGCYLAGEQSVLRHGRAADLDLVATCALGHRRLAILDPERGAQPMQSSDGRVTVLLNGEIYNFEALRDELRKQGHTFATDTDTEVLIYLYLHEPDQPGAWLRRLNGIFAFAVWDNARHRLLVARDHFGVKPFHYVQDDDAFIFASEIKAVLAAGVRSRLNRKALHAFMNVRYVPGDETLFDGVRRLPPAHFAWVERGRMAPPERYYRLPPSDPSDPGNPAAARDAIRGGFFQAVERQLLSDVPLGMALSGGLDSSMIVAAAAELYRDRPDLRLPDRRLRTFTLGFNEPTDENEDARIVAEYFRTVHHDTRLRADVLHGARDVIRAVEEPKINMIQGYELARFVQPHVKVLFSGLGGDELFAGYDIHRYCNTYGRLNHWVPRGLQRRLLGPLGRGIWKTVYRTGALRFEYPRIGAQIVLSAGDRAQFYTRLRNAWDRDPDMYPRVYARPADFLSLPRVDSLFESYFETDKDFLDQVLRAEFHTKMVDDFLVNEDRVTSAHGVEGRVPFLDRDFVELAFGIPPHLKMAGSRTKALWKQSVEQVLPEQIRDKKKHGFTFSSYHQWTKDLRDTVERELTADWCRDTGLFNSDFVREVLDYPSHPNLRWHYFMAWMMVGVKTWMEVFDVEV